MGSTPLVLDPVVIIKKVVMRSMLSIGADIDRWVTWSMGAVAAIAALLISNIGSIERVADLCWVKAALLCFVGSLSLSALCKQRCISIDARLRVSIRIEEWFASTPLGQQLDAQISTDAQRAREIMDAIADAFGGKKDVREKLVDSAMGDHSVFERGLINELKLASKLNWTQMVFAVGGFLCLALAIPATPN